MVIQSQVRRRRFGSGRGPGSDMRHSGAEGGSSWVLVGLAAAGVTGGGKERTEGVVAGAVGDGGAEVSFSATASVDSATNGAPQLEQKRLPS